MRIDKLYLQNFRCYDELKLEFDKNMTVIVGENGKGKTAILDALAISLEPYLRALVAKVAIWANVMCVVLKMPAMKVLLAFCV